MLDAAELAAAAAAVMMSLERWTEKTLAVFDDGDALGAALAGAEDTPGLPARALGGLTAAAAGNGSIFTAGAEAEGASGGR